MPISRPTASSPAPARPRASRWNSPLPPASAPGSRCTLEARPYGEILAALERGEADVAVTGPRLDPATLKAAQMTRPYFRIMARFAVAADSPLKSADAEALSGSRIGVVKDTVHARWLETYYGGSYIQPFDSLAAAGAALKAGEVDAIFGDNLQIIYWVAGEAAAQLLQAAGRRLFGLRLSSAATSPSWCAPAGRSCAPPSTMASTRRKARAPPRRSSAPMCRSVPGERSPRHPCRAGWPAFRRCGQVPPRCLRGFRPPAPAPDRPAPNRAAPGWPRRGS